MTIHTFRCLRATTGLCGALGMITAANAQTAPASNDTAQVKAPASSDTAQAKAIVVTGSRIARSADDQPAPVATITQEAIVKTGFSNLGDILTQMPQVGVGLAGAKASNFGNDGGNYGPNAGSTFVSLRDLGENRTLVLVDGLRRVSGSSLSSAVDLGTIPANMIQAVDVTTGGAAAVYGADAVTGVVNIKLRHDFNGLEVSGQTGVSTYGDDRKTQLGLLYGHSRDDDSFMVGISYNHEPTVLASARKFIGIGWYGYITNPNVTPSNPYTLIQIPGVRFPFTSYSGSFLIGNNAGPCYTGTLYTVGANNVVRPVQNGTISPSCAAYNGGDGFNIDDFNTLRTQSTVVSAMATYTKRLTSNLRFTQDIQFANSKSDASLQPLFEFGTVVKRDNPYLPASVAALMDANGLSSIVVSRTDWDQGLNHRKNNRNIFTSVSKFEGEIGSDFKWNAFYEYGSYSNDSVFTNDRIDSRYAQSVDAVAGPDGVPVCRDPAAVAAGCVPINVLGANAANPQALQYFHYDTNSYFKNTQQVAGAQLSGKLFKLPGGPVRFSTGVEYRRETEKVRGDPVANLGLLHANYEPKSSAASFNVKEAFAEVLFPILANVPFAKVLEVDVADRVSDYNTVGRTNAWKVGAEWAPIADFRFRGTVAKAVRAPNLTELDSPGALGLTGYSDPCSAPFINTGSATRAANCAALGIPANYVDPRRLQARFQNVIGNPNLEAETAKTWTIGGVLTPRFVPGLSLSVDWWSIDITKAITSLPAQTIINSCVDSSSINNVFCPLITRGHSSYAGITDPNAISVVNVSPLNLGVLKAEGVDFKGTYLSPNQAWLESWTHAPSRFRVSFDSTWYIKNLFILNKNNPGNVVHNAGTSVLPKFRFTLSPEVVVGPFSLAWTVRHIGPSQATVDFPLLYNDNKIPSVTYNDLYASYTFANPKVQLALGVNNIFNVAPPLTGNTYEGTGSGVLFDNIGRYFFVNAKIKI